ncbi:type II toxin-antitoxin system CcdA family antitoxin [Citromicrobium bathyomarinum]
MNAASSSHRKATNVSLDSAFVSEAKTLGINISQACERGLIETVREARAAAWQAENREAMDAWNEWVAENGLPLADLRLF